MSQHEIEALRREVHGIREDVTMLFDLVRRHVIPRTPTRIAISFQGAPMPSTLAAGQKVTATATEFDSAGTSITPSASSLNWSVDNPQLASIETNPDGTATITANAEGSITVTVKDEQNNLTTTDVLTITAAEPAQPPTNTAPPAEPGTPVSIAISFGTPA